MVKGPMQVSGPWGTASNMAMGLYVPALMLVTLYYTYLLRQGCLFEVDAGFQVQTNCPTVRADTSVSSAMAVLLNHSPEGSAFARDSWLPWVYVFELVPHMAMGAIIGAQHLGALPPSLFAMVGIALNANFAMNVLREIGPSAQRRS